MPALLPTSSPFSLHAARALALLLASTTLLAQTPPAQGTGNTQARPRAAPAPARPAPPPPPPCLVAEFRHLALSTHDPAARSQAAEAWLRTHLGTCSMEQLTIIANNRLQWLGTSDTPGLARLIDGAVELRLRATPGAIANLYASKGAPKPASADSTNAGPAAPASTSANTGAASAATEAAEEAALIAAGSVSTAAAVAANTAAGSANAPAATPAAASTSPSDTACEATSFFDEKLRRVIDDHYFRTLKPGECPSGTQSQTGQCVAIGSNGQWKTCEQLPKGATPNELPRDLLAKLGKLPAGAALARVGVDILLLDKPGGRVIDAVRNLGRADPSPTQPLAEVFSSEEKTRIAAWFKASFAPGKCPSGLTLRGTTCEDPTATDGPRWLMGKPLAADRITEVLFDPAKAAPVPNAPKPTEADTKRAEAFKIAKPGYKVVRVGTDILAIGAGAKPSELIVVDAILKLGAQ